MKYFNKKALFFYLSCLGIILMTSCAQILPYEEDARIILSPHKLSVHSGSEDKVFVQLLDKQGGPLFGVKITAISTSPTVATVTPEGLTDPVGKAIFIVKGISPGTTHIVFSGAGKEAKIEVIFIEH